MTSQQQVAAEVKAVIERVVSGGDTTVDEVEALLKNRDDFFTRPVAEAWHQLFHWAVDADIRAKDPAYALAQRENLASILADLAPDLPAP